MWWFKATDRNPKHMQTHGGRETQWAYLSLATFSRGFFILMQTGKTSECMVEKCRVCLNCTVAFSRGSPLHLKYCREGEKNL
jgi:hypothetical protein